MHSNLWAMLYLTLLPSALLLIIGIVLLFRKKKAAKALFVIAALFLLFPASFLFEHFSKVKKEMKLRSGVYAVSRQEKSDGLCKDSSFNALTLTVLQDGNYRFNYTPCFATTQTGHWNWDEDMVGTFTNFDNINDSLTFYYPIDRLSDTILIRSNDKTYLVFAKKL